MVCAISEAEATESTFTSPITSFLNLTLCQHLLPLHLGENVRTMSLFFLVLPVPHTKYRYYDNYGRYQMTMMSYCKQAHKGL